MGHLILLSPGGNDALERKLSEAGFSVSVVSTDADLPIGILVLDLTSPDQAQS